VSILSHQPLSGEQIDILRAANCTAEDWSDVHVTHDFDPTRIVQVQFVGKVRLGNCLGLVAGGSGLNKPAGIYDAYVANCTIGDGVRIARIGAHLSGYHIGDGACIEDVGVLQADQGNLFGNGVQVEALNEGGGREVTLFNELSAQFAYLQCLVRWRPKLIENLSRLAAREVESARCDWGTIGRQATILSVARMENVNLGESAVVRGATSLVNGTILSCPEAPTVVGAGVIAEDFIIAEGSHITEGAILSKSFVGQACQIGKQFSAEGSLFFANSEGFHGEACSLFAGPYTVTHHKSTLLIAGLMSFYNAGSGTNQSNHMYKLGPVHEGKLERGCKTGSFSYLMWPCRVGPFSVVLGKHTRTFDTRDFPFSHIEAKAGGKCEMVPGLYLLTVGTVRDGQKWPERDRRTAPHRRDLIDFDVFSPLTVGRMLRGTARLQELMDTTDRSVKVVTIEGAEVRRVLLRTGIKYYKAGIEMYLQERLVSRVERAHRVGNHHQAIGSLTVDSQAVFSDQWIDLAGQLMPETRFDTLCEQIETGQIGSVAELQAALMEIHTHYEEDEWAWTVWAYQQHFGQEVTRLTTADLRAAAESWRDVRTKFLKLILYDAGKEFESVTQTGFGISPTQSQRMADFTGVRGTCEQNKFVRQIEQEIMEVAQRVEAL
jgi:hypothetical protein